MNKKRILGYLSIIAGASLLLGNLNLTGAVIGTSVSNSLSLVAFCFLVGGILLILTSKKKLEVYVRDGKYEGERFIMTDPELYFSRDGFVRLKDFREQVKSLQKDPELMDIVRKDYEPELSALRESDDENISGVAESFLKVLLGDEYREKEASDSKRELVSKTEEQEIRTEFGKGWKNKPNSAQARVLRTFGLDYEPAKTGGHGRIYSTEYPGIFATTSSSPGDTNAGKNIGRDVVKILKEARAKKSKD